MSSIGKVFIVLNLILAGLFAGWAYSAHVTTQDFKSKFEQRNKDYDALKSATDKQVADQAAQLANLKGQHAAAVADRDQLKLALDSAKADVESKKRENETMQGNLTTLRESINTYNDKLSALEQSKNAAHEKSEAALAKLAELKDAMNAGEMKLRDTQDSLRQSEAMVASLTEKLSGAEATAKKTKTTLDAVVAMTGVSLADVSAQKHVEAAVLGVKLDVQPGLVMLNVGKDHEVKRGMTFQIYNGNQYKGEVRVENVQGSQCSALVTMAVPGQSMAQGDLATTHL